MQTRTRALFRLSASLQRLSCFLNVCVVVINQVTAAFTDSDEMVPAMGLAWSHCINCRLVLKRDSDHLRRSGDDDLHTDLGQAIEDKHSVRRLVVMQDVIRLL